MQTSHELETWEDICSVHRRTGFPIKSLRKWIWQGRIPYYRKFGRIRFKPKEVDVWMEQDHTKPLMISPIKDKMVA